MSQLYGKALRHTMSGKVGSELYTLKKEGFVPDRHDRPGQSIRPVYLAGIKTVVLYLMIGAFQELR